VTKLDSSIKRGFYEDDRLLSEEEKARQEKVRQALAEAVMREGSGASYQQKQDALAVLREAEAKKEAQAREQNVDQAINKAIEQLRDEGVIPEE